MRRLWADRSLQTQVTLLSAAGAAVVGLGAMLVIPDADGATAAQVEIFRLRLALVLLLTCGVCTALLVTGLRRLLSPLDTLREGMTRIIEGHVDAISPGPAPNPDTVLVRRTFDRMVEQFRAEKDAHQHAQKILAARNRTVDRLLEFSQTIQGAGKAEQIYEGLCHFLQAELGLAGLTILSNAPDALPPTQVRACYPADLMKPECAIGEMETGLCPCLRQNLPRQFKPDSPVRCAIEQTLRLDRSHPAYCVPFNVGGKTQVLAHMLLAPGESWTDERKQLAQAYVNTTHAALTTLHLLAEAEKQSMT
ncbi:MAG: hypothetical protein ACREIT_03990, partial [Tepidisphaeraceae bacterium]